MGRVFRLASIVRTGVRRLVVQKVQRATRGLCSRMPAPNRVGPFQPDALPSAMDAGDIPLASPQDEPAVMEEVRRSRCPLFALDADVVDVHPALADRAACRTLA